MKNNKKNKNKHKNKNITIITQNNMSSNQEQLVTSHNEFIELTKYPIPRNPIRYTEGQYSLPIIPDSIHSLINANLTSLIPNIELKLHNENNESTQHQELLEWLENTKRYSNTLNQEFQEKCDIQLKKLINNKNQKIKSKEFDMEKMANKNLPEDIIREIYSYLLPETKIQILLSKYPKYSDGLLKITEKNLRKFIREVIYKKYYRQLYVISINHNQYRIASLPYRFYYNSTYRSKTYCIEQIEKLFNGYNEAKPIKQEDKDFFNINTLKFLQTIIYIGYYTGKRLHKNKR